MPSVRYSWPKMSLVEGRAGHTPGAATGFHENGMFPEPKQTANSRDGLNRALFSTSALNQVRYDTLQRLELFNSIRKVPMFVRPPNSGDFSLRAPKTIKPAEELIPAVLYLRPMEL
jgi:hypothetical protein